MPPSNPRSLRPAELIRLLNSTTVSPALTERKLYRHRQAAGRHIGDDQTIDLLRYTAWLFDQWRTNHSVAQAPQQPDRRQAGQSKRETEARKQREQSQSVRDIGEIPSCENKERRERCGKSLREFLETYFADTFRLEWSKEHLKAIRRIERAVQQGQRYMIVLPRGFGKTSLSVRSMLWAFLYGLTEYAVLIAATADLAEDLLNDLKTILETNDLLAADFPEFTLPIRALENLSNRCAGQSYHGRPTKIAYRKDRITFAFLEDYPGTGGVFRVGALSGKAMRGFNHTKPDGRVIRPSFFLCDDPQTDESAASITQTSKREKQLMATIGCMAGPDEQLGGVMAATVIEPDDLTCRMMDQEKHFDWLYTIAPLVREWPDKSAQSYWDEYERILRECYAQAQSEDGDINEEMLDITPATDYYRANQAVMDNGSVVTWASCFVLKAGEISALQHAYNLRIRLGEEIFEKEYQNNPLPTSDADEALSEKELLGDDADPAEFPGRLNRIPRGQVPPTADHLVAFVDIHKKLLYWMVMAFGADGFSGHVLDYGAYPDPMKSEFKLTSVKVGLKSIHRGCSEEAAILAGLRVLLETGGTVRNRKVEPLLGKLWPREDGAELSIRYCYIDTGYQKDAVEQFARETAHRGIVVPYKGRSYRNRSFDETPVRKGHRKGDHWVLSPAQGRHHQRLLLADTDHWKTFALRRLKTLPGDRGAVSLYGDRRSEHKLLARHLVDGEYFQVVTIDGRTFYKWEQPASRPDNHWWDCMVGCYVAASRLGCTYMGRPIGPIGQKKTKKRRRGCVVQG